MAAAFLFNNTAIHVGSKIPAEVINNKKLFRFRKDV